mgnify:CR=1 FL=1
MTHNCTLCNVELTDDNWYSSWKSSGRTHCKNCLKPASKDTIYKNQVKHNPRRMYVNGKYVPTTHPLYKPGNYKSFNDAAFSSFERYKKSKDGYELSYKHATEELEIENGKLNELSDTSMQLLTLHGKGGLRLVWQLTLTIDASHIRPLAHLEITS